MASVSKRRWKKPDGSFGESWTVRYKDADDTHRSKVCRSKKEADSYKRQVENELEAGLHMAPRDGSTLEAAYTDYRRYLDLRVAEKKMGLPRISVIEQHMRKVKAHFGNPRLQDIGWRDVESFYVEMVTKPSKHTGRPIKPNAARSSLSTLATFMGWAQRRSLIKINPVVGARAEIGSIEADPIETFSREEIAALFRAIGDGYKIGSRSVTKRQRALALVAILLGAACGLRRGEILALAWSDIDFEAGLISIRKNLTPPPFDEIKAPKTRAGIRIVPAPGPVLRALEAWRQFVVAEPRGLIFRRSGGGPWTHDFYGLVWHPVLHAAGIIPDPGKQHRHFHALRHFAGSAWLEAGATLPQVSKLLGHANVAITARVYAHALSETASHASLLDECARSFCAPEPLRIAHDVRKAAEIPVFCAA